MYLCVRLSEVPVSSQESERSCSVGLLIVPVTSQESERSCICV